MTNDQAGQRKEPLQILIVTIGGHYFGAPIDEIHDVIRSQKTTSAPLVKDNIVGLMNLRGHIVTEVDMARTLDIATDSAKAVSTNYSIVINRKGELYSLVCHSIGDVIDIYETAIERLPETINPQWRSVSKGVYRLPDKLLVVLDPGAIIDSLSAPCPAAV